MNQLIDIALAEPMAGHHGFQTFLEMFEHSQFLLRKRFSVGMIDLHNA